MKNKVQPVQLSQTERENLNAQLATIKLSKEERNSILSSLNIGVESKIETPKPTKGSNLDLTIIRNGSSVIVFCNGGQSEYDLLVNHGAIKGQRSGGDDDNGSFDLITIPEPNTTGNGKIPYFSCNPERLLCALQSISFSRLVSAANAGLIKANNYRSRIWGFSWFQARHWLSMLPSEENPLYNRDVAADIFEADLAHA